MNKLIKAEIWQKINLGLLFLNIFFLQSYLIRFNLFGFPSNLQELLILLNFIVFLFTKPRWSDFFSHKITITIALLSIFSTIFNYPLASDLDFFRYLKFLFFAILLVIIFLETLKTTEKREHGIKVAGLGAVMFGIFAIIYNLTGHNVAADYRLLGPLDSAVYLSYYLAPFFLYFSFKLLETRKSEYLHYSILTLIPLIFTYSMGAILASFLVFTILLAKKYFTLIKSKKIIQIILAAISLIILASIVYTKIIPTLQYNNSSLDERGQIWLTASELLKDPATLIFGLGPHQFEAHYQKTVDQVLGHQPLDYEVIQPHNIFLLFQFNFGVLGLLFLFTLIWQTIRNLQQSNNQQVIYFNLILLYFFLHGLIDTPIIKNDLLFLFLLFSELALPKLNPLKPLKVPHS